MKKSVLSIAILAACLAIVGMASATPTADVNAVLYGTSVTVDASAVSPALWTLSVGPNTGVATSPIAVTANTASWHVAASDTTSTSNAGHLQDTSNHISAALGLTGNMPAISLSGSPQNIVAGTGFVTSAPYTIALSQTVTAADAPANDYKVTITYTTTTV